MFIASVAVALGAFTAAPCNLKGGAPDFEREQKVECGWVAVPLAPGRAATIKLWTARIRATGANRRDDPVVYINGGPGIATIDSLLPGLKDSKMFALIRQERDIILFDQRGSGRSEQALCPDLAKTLNSISGEGYEPSVEEERNRSAYAACRASVEAAGMSLADYTTSATVADLEPLRKAFGARSWNLLSISYGSLVALHAMRTSPRAIRSVILNSPYPPNSVTWAEQASSAAAAYQAIDRACAGQPKCVERFGALMPKLERTLARLEQSPIVDGDKRITGRRFADALWPLAVRSATVRFVPLAIDRAHSGDTGFIKAMVRAYASGDSFGGFSPAQAMAISCHESGRTSAWFARARALFPALVDASPDDSWDRMCMMFRPGFAEPSFFAPVASAIPTLIYAGSLDAATPVIDGYQAMRFLDRATLVEVEGGAHGPMGLDDCTRGIARVFLDQPQIAPDTGCVSRRKPIEFATDGLDELIAEASQ